MTELSIQLSDALQVERLDRYLFRGFTPKPSMPRIFGGQVLAQAMNAASRTISERRFLHSFHAYFLRPGNPNKQIIYEVDPVRDGGSFTTRRVVGKQDGKAIYICSLSFMEERPGYEHQQSMPDVPPPEDFELDADFSESMSEKYPEKFWNKTLFPDWEIRCGQRIDPSEPESLPAVRDTWLRFTPSVNEDPLLNKTLLAFISDAGLMAAAFLPHGISVYDDTVQSASLDHSMWFHAPCNVNDWIFYRAESHWAANGRGLNIGKLYQRNGTLLATTVQEGLMRPSF